VSQPQRRSLPLHDPLAEAAETPATIAAVPPGQVAWATIRSRDPRQMSTLPRVIAGDYLDRLLAIDRRISVIRLDVWIVLIRLFDLPVTIRRRPRPRSADAGSDKL
jgi:hypothetical protein